MSTLKVSAGEERETEHTTVVQVLHQYELYVSGTKKSTVEENTLNLE